MSGAWATTNVMHSTAANASVTYRQRPDDCNGAAGVRVPVWTPPPNGTAGATLDLPPSSQESPTT